MFEIFKIPYAYLKFTIHIVRLGLRYSTAKGFDEEREFLLKWCNETQESLT